MDGMGMVNKGLIRPYFRGGGPAQKFTNPSEWISQTCCWQVSNLFFLQNQTEKVAECSCFFCAVLLFLTKKKISNLKVISTMNICSKKRRQIFNDLKTVCVLRGILGCLVVQRCIRFVVGSSAAESAPPAGLPRQIVTWGASYSTSCC